MKTKKQTIKASEQNKRPFHIVNISLAELGEKFADKQVTVVVFREFAERMGLFNRRDERQQAK